MTTTGTATICLTDDSAKIWRSLPTDLPSRARLLDQLRADLETSRGRRARRLREILTEGPDGMLLWLNLAGRTYDPRPRRKHLPFLSWPIQEKAARELWRAVAEGRDVLIDKSRDMGATWLCLAVFLWFWVFVPDTPLLLASRKEEYVDGRGNPDTLFWKLDYLIANQPKWLTPRLERRHMHLGNLESGSAIDGESSNADLARGGRRKAILLDEFAAVENGTEILAATADAAPCRVFNSTPKGRGNAFADVRFSGKVKVVTLHWKDHPAKGRGARLISDSGLRISDLKEAGGAKQASSFSSSFNPQSAIRNPQSDAPGISAGGAALKQRWTSPWYESECARRTSRKEIAQELDIDYLASGESFFDLDVLQRLRAGGEASELRPPLARGELRFAVSTVEEGVSYRLSGVEWVPEGGRRKLSLWCPLVPAKRSEAGHGWAEGREAQEQSGRPADHSADAGPRPRQDRNYVAFCDVAHGMGASNSVIKVADANTRQEVASFACPDTPPHELGR